MKIIFSLTFVLFFGFFSFAQERAPETKTETFEKGILFIKINGDNHFENPFQTKEITRIHKFKKNRVQKELVFITKNNKAKLA